MLCYDAILAKTGIFKGMSQLFDIKSVHWSIIPLTAQALLSPSSCPAVNADLWWRNTVSENRPKNHNIYSADSHIDSQAL